MGFVLLFFAAWLSIFVFYAMNKSLSVIENTFIYLVVLILSINFSWIVVEELKYIKLAKDPLKYTAFLLNRSVLIPMIYVILLNVIYKAKSIATGLLAAIVCIGVFLTFNGIFLYYHIWTYRKWNFIYDVILIVIMQVLAFLLHKLFRKGMIAEVKHT